MKEKLSKAAKRRKRKSRQSQYPPHQSHLIQQVSCVSDDQEPMEQIPSKQPDNPWNNQTTWTVDTIPKELRKYWNQRHSLFSRFDDGIHIDYGNRLSLN